jgi:hypothetical protein
MRPTRFRGVIGFGDQKYSQRASNYRIRVGGGRRTSVRRASAPWISLGQTPVP